MGRSRRSRIATWAALAISLVAATVAIAATRTDESAAPPATTTASTTTTTVPPTTTAPATPEFDPLTTTVATARHSLLVVHELPPSPVADEPLIGNDPERLAATFADYSPERVDAPEIPSIDGPVQGRRRTTTGWEFDSPTAWGNPASFVVTERRGEWARIQLPVRPNGSQGWVHVDGVTLSTHRYRIEIDVSDRRLRAFDGEDVIADTSVVVGKDSTPTPTGRYYVTDYDERSAGSAYGPWVLPVSGFSQALDWFADGVPVIAIHGTNRPELLGRAESNGCVRVPNDVITALRARLPLGTPVDVRA